GVAGGDGRMRRRELPGEAVAIGGDRSPAAGHIRQAGGEVLSLSIQCFVGGLQGGVRGGDVLQLLDTSGVLVGDVALLANLALKRRRAAAVPDDSVFGLLQELLIPLQHPTLLSMGLEELGQVLAQAGLCRGRFLEPRLPGPTAGRRRRPPPAPRARAPAPRRLGGPGWGAVGWGALAAGVFGAAGWAGNADCFSGSCRRVNDHFGID